MTYRTVWRIWAAFVITTTIAATAFTIYYPPAAWRTR